LLSVNLNWTAGPWLIKEGRLQAAFAEAPLDVIDRLLQNLQHMSD
jgi:hypothetical protein